MARLGFALTASLVAMMAGPALAQNIAAPDPTPEQIQAATRYALPHLLKGYRATCAKTLGTSGYIATEGDRLAAKFAAGSDTYWPQAKEALIQLAANRAGEDGGELDLFAQLPDESLKPFVDGILFTAVASELKPAACGDVQRALALLDPLPVENLAGLAGFLFEMVGKDDTQDPELSGPVDTP